jgi:hypothetical protein
MTYEVYAFGMLDFHHGPDFACSYQCLLFKTQRLCVLLALYRDIKIKLIGLSCIIKPKDFVTKEVLYMLLNYTFNNGYAF